jgi:small subunit ribosomal protein S20
MANTKQSAKRARISTAKRASNMGLRTTLRTAIKKVRKSIESGDQAAAQASLNSQVAKIDAMASKKIIHKNKAARHKSRLAHQVKALAKTA